MGINKQKYITIKKQTEINLRHCNKKAGKNIMLLIQASMLLSSLVLLIYSTCKEDKELITLAAINLSASLLLFILY